MDTTDRVYGCLIGGAIGDALGATVEGWTHDRIAEEYGTVETFREYYMPYSNTEPGSITSDTALRQYLSLAIVENGGRITPREFADALIEHLNEDRIWINGEMVLRKLSAGANAREGGVGTIPDNKIASAITPVGIVNADDPRQAYQDGFALASVLQEGEARYAAATVAAGTAVAVRPDATIDAVIQAMREHSTGTVYRAIDLAMGIADESETIEELIDALYEEFLDWRWPAVQWDREKYYRGEVFSASPLEVVPVAMAVLSVCDGEVDRSIVEGVNYGRDSDGIATIAGCIAGALHGAEAIRDEWISKCEAANRDFFEELEGDPDANFESMAERLVDALDAERAAAERRAVRLSELVGESDDDR
ncbi:MAG: ADP-ribosylglycohydrolase family protein [Halosimplex sp.]